MARFLVAINKINNTKMLFYHSLPDFIVIVPRQLLCFQASCYRCFCPLFTCDPLSLFGCAIYRAINGRENVRNRKHTYNAKKRTLFDTIFRNGDQNRHLFTLGLVSFRAHFSLCFSLSFCLFFTFALSSWFSNFLFSVEISVCT